MIDIIDYGVGNLNSVKNMLKKAGYESRITSSREEVENSEKIILPGIGAFDHCMIRFNNSGLRPIIEKKVSQDKMPVLGICVGLQMLMEQSEEGKEPGLGWIKGNTIRFEKQKMGNLKIPHMGWTEVSNTKKSTLIEDLEADARFYFVHSYHVSPIEESDILLTADYGYRFTAAVQRENVFGVQFHPEKSHKYGMRILKNFAKF